MAMRPPNATTRKIYFYRIDAGTDAGGLPVPFDASATLTAIGALAPEDRHVEDGESGLLAIVDDLSPPPRLRFARIRMDNLPQREAAGEISDLTLAEDEGLAETIHLVFFPSNILGIDWNFHGPRPSRFSAYCRVKGPQPPVPFTVRALLQHDVSAVLERMEYIKLVDLKIRAPYIDSVQEVNPTLANSFREAQRVGGAERVGLTLQPAERDRQGSLADTVRALLRRLLARDDLRQGVLKFQIAGYNADSGRIESLDLMRELLVFDEQVIRLNPRVRALDPGSAYEAIRRSYQEHQQVIVAAPTIY